MLIGTTGLAKGVDVTHKNVVNLVSLAPGNLGVAPGVRVGQVLNISFDMGMYIISFHWHHIIQVLTGSNSGLGNFCLLMQWWNTCYSRL